MVAYATVFEYGQRRIETITNAENLIKMTPRTLCRHGPHVGCYGRIYDINSVFKTRDAAERSWRKEPVRQDEFFMR